MVRKRPLLALLVTGMITLVSPEMGPGSRVRAQQPALEPLVLYDDFNTPLINPDKWFGLEIGARSQLGDLPRPSGTEISRNIVKDDRDPRDDRGHKNHRGPKNRQLRLSWRAYGSLDSDIGTTASSHALLVTDPATITAMAGTITVKEAEAVGCVTTQHNTEARARLAGSFFNTATPTPGSAVNDVFAQIFIRANPAITGLEVRASVTHCQDFDCISGQPDSPAVKSLGPIDADTPVRLLMQWDQANQQFIFQRDNEEPVTISYQGLGGDTSPPGLARKLLSTSHFVANCTTDPRPVAFIDALFDDVFVNQSAVPTP